MRKLITILLILSCFSGFAQTFPNNPHQSNASTNNNFDGAVTAVKGAIMGVFLDTTAANAVTYTKNTPFIHITTSGDNKSWMRNSTATKWLQFSVGGAGGNPVDSITTDKTQACLDIQIYWSGGAPTAYDTIQLYDGIIKSGTINQIDSVSFTVQDFLYRLGCVEYAPPDTTLVIANGDSLPRLDWIIGNSSNQYATVQGTESDNPTPPNLTPNQQLPLALIFVSADTSFVVPVPPNLDGRYVKIFIDDSIYAKKTFLNDTTWWKHLAISDPQFTYPTPVIGFNTQALDTPSFAQIPVNVVMGVQAVTGGAIPNFGFSVKSWYNTIATLKTLLDLNGATGTARFFNGITIPGASNATIQSGGLTMQFQGTNTTNKFTFQNTGSPMANNGVMLMVDNSTSTGGTNSATIYARGNNLLPNMYLGMEQNAGFGTSTPDANAAMDIVSSAGGVILPRMTTTVRDGLDDWVASVSLGAGGSGYITAPAVSIAGVIGKQPRITATIAGGAVTALTINFHGTGVPASGALVFNNTGTGGTGATGTFTKSTGNPIATWSTIINTDSTSCPIETYNGSSWISACGSGGGGGTVGNIQQVLNVGSEVTQDNDISPDVNDTWAFTIGNNARFAQVGIFGNTITLHSSDASGGIILEGLGFLKFPSIAAQHNADDSMLVRRASDGTVGFQAIPSGSGGVSSVSGTANQITSTGGSTPVLALASGGTLPGAWNLGTPASATLTNATGLPISTGVSGLGTGVATALAVNTGSAGAFVLFNGNMGTPTSGTVSTGVTLGDVTMNVTGTDATGDIYYRNGSGILTRLPIGTSAQTLHVVGGLPAWRDTTAAGGGGSGDTTVFNPNQFSLHTNSPYDTVSIVGKPNRGAYYDSDSLLTWTDNFTVNAAGDMMFAGNGQIGGSSSAGYVNDATVTRIGDYNANDAGTMVRIRGDLHTVELGDVDGNGNGTKFTLDDDAQIVTINAVNGTTVSGGILTVTAGINTDYINATSVASNPQTLKTTGVTLLGDEDNINYIKIHGSDDGSETEYFAVSHAFFGQIRTQGVKFKLTEVNSTYTILSTDYYIDANGTFTTTLPPLTGQGGITYTITNTGVGVVTLDGDGSDTINGSATQTLAAGVSVTVHSGTGTNWVIN